MILMKKMGYVYIENIIREMVFESYKEEREFYLE